MTTNSNSEKRNDDFSSIKVTGLSKEIKKTKGTQSDKSLPMEDGNDQEENIDKIPEMQSVNARTTPVTAAVQALTDITKQASVITNIGEDSNANSHCDDA